MDQNNFFKENNSIESIDQLILELKKNNDQSALHSHIPKRRFTAFLSHSPLNNPLKGQDTNTPSIDCTKV